MNLVFPGSFDPFHNGHLDVVKRAHSILASINIDRKIIIGLAYNPQKHSELTFETRIKAINATFAELGIGEDEVEVETYTTSTVDFCKKKSAMLIRGLRNSADFEYEKPMAEVNKRFGVETLFIMTGSEYSHVSSSLIRNMRAAKLDVSEYLPKPILNLLQG